MHAFLDSLPPLAGQSRRVAYRFALAAAALELAGQYGISGIAPTVASLEIKQCFDSWLMREGAGKYEDRQIIAQTENFMQQYAASYRFVHWDSTNLTADNFAGYKKHAGKDVNENQQQEYWIIPAVFETEICQGFDTSKVCGVLVNIDWLRRNKSDNRIKHKRYGKGRFYVLAGMEAPETE